MWFSYSVTGLTNTQIVKADSLEEAIGLALDRAYGFNEISEEEAIKIIESW